MGSYQYVEIPEFSTDRDLDSPSQEPVCKAKLDPGFFQRGTIYSTSIQYVAHNKYANT